MNLTVHVHGSADSKDEVHFFVTRGRLSEDRMTRREFRAFIRILKQEGDLLSRVSPGSGSSVEVYIRKPI